MKRSTMIKLLGFSAFTLLSAATYAGNMDTAQFGTLDQNQDGQLTAEEAAKDVSLSENWTTIDKDANGAIDQAEFSAFESMQMQENKPAAE
ncbi:hypothetical protein [Sedimenticola thiotaurini]|uniref:EF-hand domain-containing protein n=1 Tax=Sedimenticola thiotaurini TaxID=1543721 RepID=A0A0F7JV40_9GAMM|nr:hypothetical protein [Sedimenticola thiotaurini]AKH19194.1 hypothetical protein AAY24_01250 [Sedimenticola thiotaurini]